MLRKQLTVLGTGCFLAMSVHSALALSNPDRSLVTLDTNSVQANVSKSRYIVQLRDAPAASRSTVNSIPNKLDGVFKSEKYDASSIESQIYRQELKRKQQQVMTSAGVSEAIYTYEHSFNGFAASLTPAQLTKLKSNSEVLNVWPDELRQLDTANTPRFLGLTNPDGLHSLGNKGENMIIGIVDSGVWPENPSLNGDGFEPIELTRPDWAGSCDVGTDPEFSCNNKLIGARYYNDSFIINGTILPGEFDSPRDADGHGTHTMTTAGGNEDTPAELFGIDIGTVTGIAPRARVAAYKVCWNGRAPGNSGCSTGDSVAAIDDAVADGVDVINFSISGSRTDLTDPVHVAFFNAARGGVFNAISAGNSGPGAQTVAHNVPWVTTVGASTYDGEIALVGTQLEVDYNGEEQDPLFSIQNAGGLPEGLSGELAVAEPFDACSALTNPEEIAGKVAYIARGTCFFTDKLGAALDAGATGVVMYSDNRTPTTLPGDIIPSLMIENAAGLDLLAELENGVSVTVNATDEGIGSTAASIGNLMAGFSSRGESLATADIIKPDITAPGVDILAGDSGSQIDSGTMGESYGFKSGTSMSSPHIAGIAALVGEKNPSWSPSAIKSAIMTTARQDVFKEDGTTLADPFDFGAGHVVPNSAVAPGLVYDANFNDYYAFLCGAGDADFVEADYFPGACGALEGAGYPIDPSNLNIASIASESLSEPETMRRFVTNVSDSSAYTATIEAPAGIDVTLMVYDFNTGSFVETDTMMFNEGGLGLYDITFSHNDDTVIDEWTFGSLTWTDGTHSVRSPIALKPTLPPRVTAPESVSIETLRSAARISLPVDIAYNGRFIAQGIGMDAPDIFVDTVLQDADQSFSFNEPGLGFYFVNVPEGTRVAKFSLRGDDYDSENVDLDMFVYACPSFSCTQLGSGQRSGSDESVVLVDPTPLADLANSDIYLVFVLGWSLDGAESVDAPLYVHTVDESRPSGMSVRASSRAVDGRTSRVYVGMSGLQSGTDYVGGVIYKDQDGNENGITVLEVKAQ